MQFSFDMNDLRAIRAHLPQLRKQLSEMLKERERLSADIQQLQDLIAVSQGVSRRSGKAAPSPQPRRRRAAPSQDRAVQALEQASAALAGTAVGPTSLYNYMIKNGLDAPKDATVLGTNLWDAWQAGRIRRAPNGVYLPLDASGKTEVDYPLTDYYYASEQGLPVPARPGRFRH